jgi:hypothetical protein
MAVNACALWLGRHCGPRVDIRRMEPPVDGGECLRALIRAALGSARWYTANGAARGLGVNVAARWDGQMAPRVDMRRMEPRADGDECLRAVIRAALGAARWYTANGAARGLAVNVPAWWFGPHWGPRVDIRRMAPRVDWGWMSPRVEMAKYFYLKIWKEPLKYLPILKCPSNLKKISTIKNYCVNISCEKINFRKSLILIIY